jgi:diketogulonate reductase-like aldo/keto reductase
MVKGRSRLNLRDKRSDNAEIAMHGNSSRTIRLRTGTAVPVLGQGVFTIPSAARREAEMVAAIRMGVKLGMGLVDAGLGDTGLTETRHGAEKLVGEAIAGLRDEVFLVARVRAEEATRGAMAASCEESLRQLGSDWIDLYLLEGRLDGSMAEAVEAVLDLVRLGLVDAWGASSFDLPDMLRLAACPGGETVAVDEVSFSPARRALERDLLPWCRSHGIVVFARADDDRNLIQHDTLRAIAHRHGATVRQVILAWILRHDHVTALISPDDLASIEEGHAALNLALTEANLSDIDRAFPLSP